MTDPAVWGIEPGYYDISGTWHVAPPATVSALLAAMRADGDRPPGVWGEDAVWVVRAGDWVRVDETWELELESGESHLVESALAPDTPLGYHWLRRSRDGREVRLIVTPPRCFLPQPLRQWGWSTQLYATRSRASWGIGDFGDLRDLTKWAAQCGADLVQLNPLHAPPPGFPQQPSPYSPSSRAFRSPLYIRIEDVPGAHTLGPELEELARRTQALNTERRIDRNAVWRSKLEALDLIWKGFDGDSSFDAYLEREGEVLQKYALYCVLAERLGPAWLDWPAEFHHPNAPGIARIQQDSADRIRFHQWLQWILDEQLGSAVGEAGILQDLAIGSSVEGADVWMWQDSYALDVTVGVPADEFNSKGQDWSFPPLDPWRLRVARFEPFIAALRTCLRHSSGLRVDHVMGLFRLYWIPPGGEPGDGTYVRYPWQEMLDIVALETHRAGAFIVGEDLGTVEDWMRHELARRDILSYRLMWFEKEPPSYFPEKALAAVGTHDLPTIAGLWSGSDLNDQRELALEPNEAATNEVHARLQKWLDVDADAPIDEVSYRAHALLADTPSAIVTASLADAIGMKERMNFPGTVDEWPNWSMALPLSIEEIEDDPSVKATADVIERHRES